MKRQVISTLVCLLVLSTFVFQSCVDVDLSDLSKDIKLQQTLVVPLGEGTLTVGNFLSSFSEIGDNMSYTGDTINFLAESEDEYSFKNIDILAASSSSKFSGSFGTGTLSKGVSVAPSPVDTFHLSVFASQSATLHCDSVHATRFDYDVSVTVSGITRSDNTAFQSSDLSMTFVYSKIKEVGKSSSFSQQVSYQPGSTLTNSMSDVQLNTAGHTTLPIQVQFKSNRDLKLNNAKIDIVFTPKTMTYTQAWGVFKLVTNTKSASETSLSVLNDLPSGIHFYNPQAYPIVSTNVGMYLDYNIDSVSAYSKEKAWLVSAFFKSTNSKSVSYSIKRRAEQPEQIVQDTLIKLDRDNGGTNKIFETAQKPAKLVYSFHMTPSASNTKAGEHPFITPNMNMKVLMKVVIPFKVTAADTVDYSDTIADVNDVLSKINNAAMIMKVYNGIPVRMNLKFKFLDASGAVLDTEAGKQSYTIDPAEIDAKGVSTGYVVTQQQIVFSQADQTQINKADKIVYTVGFSGKTKNTTFTITKDDNFKIVLGAYSTLNYNTTIDSLTK